jgi:integrase
MSGVDSKRLNDTIVKNLISRDKKYSVSDGNGLQITIKTDSKKIWEVRYTSLGKSNTTTLGSYPTTSLNSARRKCEEFKKKLLEGVNPIQEKKRIKEQMLLAQKVEESRRLNTFEKVARDFLESISNENSPKYLSKKLGRLINHVFPIIGDKPISDLSRLNVIECLDVLKVSGKIETAQRISNLIAQVFRYGVAREITPINITAEIDNRYVIGKKVVRHFPTITEPSEVGQLLRAIDNYHGNPIVKLALKLSIYTAQRPANIRFAEWNEFDLDSNAWNLPTLKMKMRRNHIVPITKQVRAVLEELEPLTRHRSIYLFPSLTSNVRPISENTLNQALRRLSYSREEIVSHSFRAMFSTIANEHTPVHGYNSDVIERHLAHVEGNKIRGAYNHAEYFEQRVGLMEWYCNYLDSLV